MKKQIKCDETMRLDKYLVKKLDFSRNQVQELIKKELVLVNDQVQKANYKLKLDQKITIEEELKVINIIKYDLDVPIVYEDEHLLIVNKPRNLVVHPANGHQNDTLVNVLANKLADFKPINGVIRPGIVHRIDKDTSGLLVVAKDQKTNDCLVEMLKNKEIIRKYIALIHNSIDYDRGTINAPIGRSEKDRKKMDVTSKNSKKAITHFKTLKRYKNYSLIECTLETGRTHQIRVHLSHLNFPIVGDQTYGYKRDQHLTNGQMLQSYYIKFTHPITQNIIEFELELDPYIKNYINEIEKGEKDESDSEN